MSVVRLIFFIFFLFPLTCFAYEIEPYSGQGGSGVEAPVILSFVFCPLNYQNNDNFLKDMDVIIQRLNKTMPFDEFVGRIRFYYVSLSKEEENTIFKKTQDFPPLKVRRDFLDDILTYVKSNYKLIIFDAGGSVSCAEFSSVDKMSLVIVGKRRYINQNSFAKGFLHELGHSLGLRDEGLNSEAALCLPGPPNCAVTEEEAKNWWGYLVGKVSRVHYIRGCCGNKNYIRSTIASLMNDPDKAEDFGPVNERYLRGVLVQTMKIGGRNTNFHTAMCKNWYCVHQSFPSQNYALHPPTK